MTREVSSIHRDTLINLFDALAYLSNCEEWYEHNPKITITKNPLPKGGFTAVIVLDWHNKNKKLED